jgi:hypothetical protein
MITHTSIGYSGRLGNQMFQYATLKALALRKGYEPVLPIHTQVKKDGVYDYTNGKWISYKLDLQECFNLRISFQNTNLPKMYREVGFTYDNGINKVEDDTSLEGYFQSYKYFEDYSEEVLKDFTFQESILKNCQKALPETLTEIVAVHVRRGDYVAHPGYWNTTPEYLQQALNEFSDKEYLFLVFSDDLEWCKSIFPEGTHYSEGRTQFEDLCLMSMCDHNIISNSSFSWWGAYLNANKDKRVIAPKEWFIPAKPLSDLYPKNWIVL